MIINHNLNSMNAHRNMSFNTNQTGKAMEKLSSGLRINRAGDDAAGLAISEKMRGQIRGLDQASRNSQDAVSLIQTAEGGLNETHSILQRMRELSVQSSNDTNTNDDRKNIQDEMKQLGTEIDRIANQTEFNTKKLLNGSMGEAQVAAAGTITNTGNLAAGTSGATTFASLSDKDNNNLGIQVGDVITATWSVNGTQKSAKITVTATGTTSTLTGLTAAIAGEATIASAATTAGVMTLTAATTGTANQINGFSIEVKSGNVRKEAASNALSNFAVGTEAKDTRTDGSATFHIGANNGQTINLSLSDMKASTLGVNQLQVGTQSQSETAVKVIDSAIKKVSEERSKLGSVQNRLEHTINNLNVGAENLQAAESRIRDVDMAKEMMNFTKNNILNQAAQAMMAQSNQQPQAVLQLLR